MIRKLKKLYKILKNEYHWYWCSVYSSKYVKKYYNFNEKKWNKSTNESNKLFLKSWQHLEKMDKDYMRLKTYKTINKWAK